jgi:hypothetical protein
LSGGERLPHIRRQVHAANTEYLQQFERMLTKPQQSKLAAQLGEPFTAEIALDAPMVVRLEFNRSVYADEFFNLYSFEPEFLVNEAVQKELALTDEQREKANKFRADWEVRLGWEIKARKSNFIFAQESPRDMSIAAIRSAHNLVGTGLNKILTPMQLQRFNQIMAQHRFKKAGIVGACGFPDMADSIFLIKTNIEALRNTPNPREVFSHSQWETFERKLGQPFNVDVQYDDRGVFTKTSKNTAAAKKRTEFIDITANTFAGFMLNNSGRLRLTPDQTARLKELADDSMKIRVILHKELSNLPAPAELGGARMNRPETRAHEIVRKAIHEQCVDVLDKQQQSLLKGLSRGPVPFDP